MSTSRLSFKIYVTAFLHHFARSWLHERQICWQALAIPKDAFTYEAKGGAMVLKEDIFRAMYSQVLPLHMITCSLFSCHITRNLSRQAIGVNVVKRITRLQKATRSISTWCQHDDCVGHAEHAARFGICHKLQKTKCALRYCQSFLKNNDLHFPTVLFNGLRPKEGSFEWLVPQGR